MKQVYSNNSGKSGVVSYEIGEDFIIVEFESGTYNFYKYTYLATGRDNVEEMKRLALLGEGLNTFIGRRKDYDSRW